MPVMRVAAQVSIFLLIGWVMAPCARAFGPEGHLLVGAVADRYLCADARNAVNRLLEGQSLGQAGRWADWIRSDPEWRHTRTWHYINVGDDESIEQVSNGDHQDVVWAIRHFDRRLADETVTAEERATALRFLAHFTADVHQPLHVGRAEDRGGNRIAVRVGERNTNLHAVWDAQALLKDERKARGSTRDQQVEALIVRTRGRVDALQADSPLDWARESQALRATVYAFQAPEGAATAGLDSAYLAVASDLVHSRLSAAGVRLAARINRIFCRLPDAR
jgi:hypothetical protein